MGFPCNPHYILKPAKSRKKIVTLEDFSFARGRLYLICFMADIGSHYN